ncbi:MAG: sulfotransferase family 2 domain-containing protein [Rhizomicrobium sp.]
MAVQFIANAQPRRRNPAPLVDPVSKTMLFWMHRCGSTTAQLWFFEIAGWKSRMAGKGASHLSPLWYEEHADLYRDLASCYDDPSFLKIAAVRNPLSRTVSAYSVVTDTVSGAQWRAVSRSIRDPDPEKRLTFNEFLDFLEQNDVRKANYHWRMQTASDWFERKLPGVMLVKLESLQQDLDRLAVRLGKRPIAMKRSSATTKTSRDIGNIDITNLNRADFARLFGRDRRGVIQFPDYRHFLNAETTARIAKIYARDFEVLGYPIAA